MSALISPNHVFHARVRPIALALLLLVLVAAPARSETFVSGPINSDTTWDLAGSPYVIQISGVSVSVGVTLTIEAGVVVKGQLPPSDLTVNGTLIADGTSAPIIFTSYADDSAGGDTNGDGTATAADRGDWQGLQLGSTSAGHVLRGLEIRYGGSAEWGPGTADQSSLRVAGAEAAVEDSVVTGSLGSAVRVSDSLSFSWTGGSINNTPGVGLYATNVTSLEVLDSAFIGSAISAESSQVDIRRNTFSQGRARPSDLGVGSSSTGTIANNTLTESNAFVSCVRLNALVNFIDNTIQNNAVDSPAVSVGSGGLAATISGNVITGNTRNEISLDDNVQPCSMTFGSDAPYSFESISTPPPFICADPVLEFQGGAVLKGRSEAASIDWSDGLFLADGTLGTVNFTSYADDTLGGDTNGDGGATTPALGDWKGIRLRGSLAPVTLTDVGIAYAGASDWTPEGNDRAGLRIDGVNVAGSNLYLRLTSGIVAGDAANLSITGSTFEMAATALNAERIANLTLTDSIFRGSFLRATESALEITGNAFTTGTLGLALFGDGCTGRVENNSFENGNLVLYGVQISSAIEFTANSVSNNSGDAPAIILGDGAQQAIITGNTITGNRRDEIFVVSPFFVCEMTFYADAPYSIGSIISANPSACTSQEIVFAAGAIVKGRDETSNINWQNGLFFADGSLSPIVFTSYQDDAVGGDTNGDGFATAPDAGDWKGIRISSPTSGHRFTGVTLGYASSGDWTTGASDLAGLLLDGTAAALQRSTFSNMQVGVRATNGAALTLSQSTIQNSSVRSGSNASVTMEFNTFEDSSFSLQESALDLRDNSVRNTSVAPFASYIGQSCSGTVQRTTIEESRAFVAALHIRSPVTVDILDIRDSESPYLLELVADGRQATLANLRPEGNLADRIRVSAGSDPMDGTMIWDVPVPYLLTADPVLSSGGSLTLGPGTSTLGTSPTRMTIEGTFSADRASVNFGDAPPFGIDFVEGSSASIVDTALLGQILIHGLSNVSASSSDISRGRIVAYGSNSESIDLRSNWWGTTDPAEIENKIFHQIDDPTRPLVLFEPFMLSPPASALESLCDGVDQDGDGSVDEGCDQDGDGYCAEGSVVGSSPACPAGDNDCNDLDPSINPGAIDTADGIDTDCNGLTDDAAGSISGRVLLGHIPYQDGIVGAEVRLLNQEDKSDTGLPTTTDESGDYTISGIPIGEYVVEARIEWSTPPAIAGLGDDPNGAQEWDSIRRSEPIQVSGSSAQGVDLAFLPIVFVHGYLGGSCVLPEGCGFGIKCFSESGNTWEVFFDYVRQIGGMPFVAYGLSSCSVPDCFDELFPERCGLHEHNAGQLATFLEYVSNIAANQLVDRSTPVRFDVVAHSMGGLTTRAMFKADNSTGKAAAGRDYVRNIVFMATPNAGTVKASLARNAARTPTGFDGNSSGLYYLSIGHLAEFNSEFGSCSDMGSAAQSRPRVYYVSGSGGWGLEPNPEDRWVGRQSVVDCIVPGPSSFAFRSVAKLIDIPPPSDTDYVETVDTHDFIHSVGLTMDQVFIRLDRERQPNTIPCGQTRDCPGATDSPTDETGTYARTQASEGDTAYPNLSYTFSHVTDPSDESVFSLNWGAGELTFSLRTPSGILIDRFAAESDPLIDYFEDVDGTGENSASYRVLSPEGGTWDLLVDAGPDIAPEGEPFVTFSTSMGAPELTSETEPTLRPTGGAVMIAAKAEESGAPMLGLSVTAFVKDPLGEPAEVTLLDDGLGPDVLADDGIYSGSYDPLGVSGIHQITFFAEGLRVDGEPFTRASTDRVRIQSDGARFGGNSDAGFSDRLEDNDGIAGAEFLVIDVDIDVFDEGNYSLSGTLETPTQTVIQSKVLELGTLLPGTRTVGLRFDGSVVREAGEDGPYTLSQVALRDVNANRIPADELVDAHQTASYLVTEFQAADLDEDGITDTADNCPQVANPDQADFDADGVGDVCDVCPNDLNPDQADSDGDGAGDICDACQSTPEAFQSDVDGDGTGDACDEDADSDGFSGTEDCAPINNSLWWTPDEVTGLRIESDQRTLAWDPQVSDDGAEVVYDVARGSLGDLLQSGAYAPTNCPSSGGTAATAVDATEPEPGRGFYYLVRSKTVCAAGTYGSGSAGTVREPEGCF